jgi:acetyl esterase/lipase
LRTGWALGDLDTESNICKHIVSLSGVAVIDVAYRLVPESPFPIGILDSFAALKYITSPYGVEQFNVNPTKMSVGGISAGGNIALILAHLARDADIHLRLVAVGTPPVDDLTKYKTAQESPYKSMQEMEFAPILNWARLKWFDDLKWSSLRKDPDVRKKEMGSVNWFVDLMTAPSFKNLCKTVIYTAACDPLRDEGEAYGRKLLEAGNVITMKRFEGVPHAFMHMDAGKSSFNPKHNCSGGHANKNFRPFSGQAIYRDAIRRDP